jgi:hypothetical protein
MAVAGWQWQWQGGSGGYCQLIGVTVAVVAWQWYEWIGSVIVSILICDSAAIGVFWSGNMAVTTWQWQQWQWQWQGGSGGYCQLIGVTVAVVGLQWCEWIDYAIASILIGDSAEFGVL